MRNVRAKHIYAGGAVGVLFILALLIPNAADAWTSVHLSASTVCTNGQTIATVTATNSESEAAHVVAQTGNAWTVGDNIPPPSQSKTKVITATTAFQLTVDYPSDGTDRPSNSVTVYVLHDCEATTTSSSTTSSTSTSTSSTSTSTSSTSTSSTSTTQPTTTTTVCEDSSAHRCTPLTTVTTKPSTTSTTAPQTTLLPPTSLVQTPIPARPSFTG